jgi:hypothetical protein
MVFMAQSEILVYLQAVPVQIPEKTRNFRDLGGSSMRMSHSSKRALDRALRASEKVIGLGHSAILSEALARGAKDARSLPLCDDPFAQAESMRKAVHGLDSFSILVGENLDGPFSGAALCGVISANYDLGFSFDSDWNNGSSGYAVLVRDSGLESYNIDIRNIEYAASKKFSDSMIIGDSSLNANRSLKRDVLSNEQSPREIASLISRKLHRLSSN